MRGGRGELVSVAAGPDEVEGVGLVAFDQRGVDRGREAGVVELDREVLAALAGGLLPGGAEFNIRAREDAVVGRLLVDLVGRLDRGLGVDAERLDRAGEGGAGANEGADGRHGALSCFSGPRPSRPRWRSPGRRRSTTHSARAGAERRMAA